MATRPRNRRKGGSSEQRPVRTRSSGGSGLFAAAAKGALVAACVVGIYLSYQHYQENEKENARIREENRKIREQNRENKYEYEVKKGSSGSRKQSRSLAKVDRKKTATPVKVQPKVESEDFLRFKSKGNELFFSCKFEEASAAFGKAVTFPAPKSSIAKIRDASDACKVFAAITAGVKQSVESTADGLYDIKLKSGGRIRARVTNQNHDTVWYIKDKLRGQLSRRMIDSMTPVKQADIDRKMREELEDTVARAKAEDDTLSFYLAAKQALKFNFKKDAAKLLKKAYDLEKERGGSLAQTVREYKARKLFNYGAYYYSVGAPKIGNKRFQKIFNLYPNTLAAKFARETMEELKRKQELVYVNKKKIAALRKQQEKRRREARDAADRNRQEAENAAADAEEEEGAELAGITLGRDGDVKGKDTALINAANEQFKVGVKEYNLGMSVASARESNHHYKKAIKHLEKALESYNKAYARDPNNSSLAERVQVTATKLYWARKSKRFGM